MNDDPSSPPHGPLADRAPLLIFLAVFLIATAFAWYTGHAWEDWYITFRISKNFAGGHGLVYAVGEKVHAFTSPLGTLLPALLSYVTGQRSDELVLWLFRIIGCGLLGLSAVMLLGIARAVKMTMLPATLMIGLFAFDAKSIDFSINGMETAFVLFFLAATLHALAVPSGRFVARLGLAWAGLMWTRPDGFIYIGGLALGCLLFNPPTPHFTSRGEMLRKFIAAGTVTAALYLPWFLWTWQYYGTPIPHTVVAKGLTVPGPTFDYLKQLITLPFRPVAKLHSMTDAFTPPNSFFGGWPQALTYYSYALSMLCSFYWCLPVADRRGRAVSFALFASHAYLTLLVPIVFAWYIPSVTLLSIVAAGHITQYAAERIGAREAAGIRRLRRSAYALLRVCVVAALGTGFALTVATAVEVKVQQEVIETGNRKEIGLWLKEHAASPGDTVFLECLGYIGFYSQLKMLDVPGLASPEVVAVRRELRTDEFAPLIRRLRPDWLVLRPGEIESIREQEPTLLSAEYVNVRTFDAAGRLNSYSFIPGRPYLQYDQSFTVYMRKDRQNRPPAGE